MKEMAEFGEEICVLDSTDKSIGEEPKKLKKAAKKICICMEEKDFLVAILMFTMLGATPVSLWNTLHCYRVYNE